MRAQYLPGTFLHKLIQLLAGHFHFAGMLVEPFQKGLFYGWRPLAVNLAGGVGAGFKHGLAKLVAQPNKFCGGDHFFGKMRGDEQYAFLF